MYRRMDIVTFVVLFWSILSVAADSSGDECILQPDGTCEAPPLENENKWIIERTVEDKKSYMYLAALGVKQLVESGYKKDIEKRMQEVVEYMKNNENAVECQLRNELCANWAVVGECDKNPGYMLVNCAPACFTCDQVSYETRCAHMPPDDTKNIWSPGSLNAMFERIAADPKVQVLFRPAPSAPNDGPWVVVVDDFLTPHECQTLITLGGKEGYEQSMDVGGEMKFDGTYGGVTSLRRTSTNAWCWNDCYDHAVTKKVTAKIEKLLGIPESNFEHFQLLKYEEEQFYEIHHDYIDHDIDRPQGVRILTVFLYLNDVEEGGGTNFPLLNTTVLPKRGRVLMWPSVLDENPNEKDPRTDHQALPVIKGIKYGANAWVHARDFKAPHAINCI